MAQVFNRLYVDVRTETNDIITAVQNDSNSRFLDVFLLDNGLPINLTGHEVRIYGKKADGTEFYNNGAITNATAGRCQFELTSQALAVANDLEVQIILFKNNVEVLSTQAFKIHVVKSLFSSSAVTSSNEYGALVVLYQNLYEAYDLMTTMVQNMGEAGTIATERNADTFWKMLEYMAQYLDTNLTDLLNTVLSEASVQGVTDRLGNTTDTGGTATAGTVMGKLNSLIKGRHRSYKVLSTALGLSQNDCIILSISGSGEFYGLRTIGTVTSVKVIADGIEYKADGTNGTFTYKPSITATGFERYIDSGTVSYLSTQINNLAPFIPFSESLVIKISTGSANPSSVSTAYSIYQ